jgi:hypothetical protein
MSMQEIDRPVEASRSLTLLTSSDRGESERSHNHGFARHALGEAAFLAQLMAVKLDQPIQRLRRREAPDTATGHYMAGRRLGNLYAGFKILDLSA